MHYETSLSDVAAWVRLPALTGKVKVLGSSNSSLAIIVGQPGHSNYSLGL